jgi:hypothetical protein
MCVIQNVNWIPGRKDVSMNTLTNKPQRSQVLAPQQIKTPQVPAPQQAHDIPRPKLARTIKPTNKDIANRAYEIYIEKGCQQGQCEQDWEQAEQELKKLFSQKFGHACIGAGMRFHRHFQIGSHVMGNPVRISNR